MTRFFQIEIPSAIYPRYRSGWISAFAGMAIGVVLAVCLILPVNAKDNATLPPTSLFFTPEEAREAEMLAQKFAPAGQGDIHLGAIIYYGPHDWTLWLQREKWTPETSRDDLRVLKVTADEVRLMWRGEDGATEQEITLRPNQSYQLSTGKIIAGP